MTEPLALRMEDANYVSEATRKPIYFNGLPSPYFFHTVRSFGECGADRDEIWPRRHYGSQEVFAKKPANTGDFQRSNFGERYLPKG